jgi:hypothetical protein
VEFEQGFAPYRLGLAGQNGALSVGEPDSLSLQPFFEQALRFEHRGFFNCMRF